MRGLFVSQGQLLQNRCCGSRVQGVRVPIVAAIEETHLATWRVTNMLVLTRRIGETIVINGDIRLTVNSIKGDKVRLGIAAPEFVRVDRQEIHERRFETAIPAHDLESVSASCR